MNINRRVINKEPLVLKEATDTLFKATKLRDEDRFGILKFSPKQTYTEPLAQQILPLILEQLFSHNAFLIFVS